MFRMLFDIMIVSSLDAFMSSALVSLSVVVINYLTKQVAEGPLSLPHSSML